MKNYIIRYKPNEVLKKYGYGGKTKEVKNAETIKEKKELKKLGMKNKVRGKIVKGEMNYGLGRSLGYKYR